MMLVTLRGGPTLHIWWEGCEIASVPLTPHAALELAAALLREARAALARGEVAGHVGGCNMPPATAADLGLRRDEIHEARQ